MTVKIDLVTLNQMIRDGKTGHECAVFFKTSDSAISQARKKLKGAMVKHVVMEQAHQVLQNELDTFAQLNKINADTIQLMEFLKSWLNGDQQTLDRLKKTHVLKGCQFKDPGELLLKAARECLEQLRFQSHVFERLYDMTAVSEFQQSVMSAIETVSPEARNAIIQKLKERNIIRRSITS